MALNSPENWSDCGMDWSAPDPRNANYAFALFEAVCERMSVIDRIKMFDELSKLAQIGPGLPLNRSWVELMVEVIEYLIGHFVDPDMTGYDSSYSDFPRMLSFRTVNLDPGCRICELPITLTTDNVASLFQRMRNCLNRLYLTTCEAQINVTTREVDSSGKYSSMSAAENEAIRIAGKQVVDETNYYTTDRFDRNMFTSVSGYTDGYIVSLKTVGIRIKSTPFRGGFVPELWLAARGTIWPTDGVYQQREYNSGSLELPENVMTWFLHPQPADTPATWTRDDNYLHNPNRPTGGGSYHIGSTVTGCRLRGRFFQNFATSGGFRFQ